MFLFGASQEIKPKPLHRSSARLKPVVAVYRQVMVPMVLWMLKVLPPKVGFFFFQPVQLAAVFSNNSECVCHSLG